MSNKYLELKKKTQDKIDKAMQDFADAKKDLLAARKEIDEQEKKQKKETAKYDAKKHQAAKKNEILSMGDCKRFEREITLLEKQLKDFADGFEDFQERQKIEQNVKDHAKSVFFEVEKFADTLGDTTKKLQTAYEQCQQLYTQKKDDLARTSDEYRQIGQTILEATKPQKELVQAEAKLPEVKAKVAKLSAEVVLLKKKVGVLEERFQYYEKEKGKFKQMLSDGQIDDKEYKYYKEALKRELK